MPIDFRKLRDARTTQLLFIYNWINESNETNSFDNYLYYSEFKRLKALIFLFYSSHLKYFKWFYCYKYDDRNTRILKCLRRVFIVFAMHKRDKQSSARNRHAIACQFPSTIRRNFEVHIGDIVCRYKSALSSIISCVQNAKRFFLRINSVLIDVKLGR